MSLPRALDRNAFNILTAILGLISPKSPSMAYPLEQLNGVLLLPTTLEISESFRIARYSVPTGANRFVPSQS